MKSSVEWLDSEAGNPERVQLSLEVAFEELVGTGDDEAGLRAFAASYDDMTPGERPPAEFVAAVSRQVHAALSDYLIAI